MFLISCLNSKMNFGLHASDKSYKTYNQFNYAKK
jgi:hypothetical protein